MKQRILLLLLILAPLSLPAASRATTYFGPVTIRVGGPGELPLPGQPWVSPSNLASAVYFVGDTGVHASECVVLADPYYDPSGVLTHSGFVGVDPAGAYSALYPAWFAAHGLAFGLGSWQTCTSLLAAGVCVRVSGHVNLAPDIFGQSAIVDSIAAATCP